VHAGGACVCDAGYVRAGAGANYTCEACPRNTFEALGACTPCGVDAQSAPASISEADCRCQQFNCSYGVRYPP